MTMPLTQCENPSPTDIRTETRTHLFLVAMLSAGHSVIPVRIRNLSSSGALVEAAALPEVGRAITVRRGSLKAEGIVAWRAGDQAGLTFKSHIDVPLWLPGKSSSRQCTIDRVVFESRDAPGAKARPRAVDYEANRPDQLVDELQLLKGELINLAEALVQDIILVATHPEIQMLDVAIQRVDRSLSFAMKSDRVRQDRRLRSSSGIGSQRLSQVD